MKKEKNMKSTVVAVVIAGLLAAAIFYFVKYQETQKLLKNPNEAVKTEVQDLVAKVNKLIVLPKDEQPTVATVQDKSKLKGQPFFAKAENGDKVLIFIKEKRAILYRPSTNKIIDVSPINISDTKQNAPTKAPEEKKTKVTPTEAPTKTPSPTPEAKQ